MTRAKAVAVALALAVLGAGLAGCTSHDNGGVIVPAPATTTTAPGFGGANTTLPGASSTSVGTLPSG